MYEELPCPLWDVFCQLKGSATGLHETVGHASYDRPTPDVFWQKDEGELPSSRTSFQNFKKTLKISNVDENDAGDYRCTATNKLGSAHHTIKVHVKGTHDKHKVLHFYIA